MSRRNEVLMILACVAAWLMAAYRMREAITFDVAAAPLTAVSLAARPQVIHDAMRIGREGAFRPLSAWSEPVTDSVTDAPAIPFERPPVHLKGIMGGPPWFAVLSTQGAAGDDRVLHVGDSLGAIEVRAVWADGVSLRFQDSTWAIPLHEPDLP